ncbi:Uncharacterised protein [Bacteroides ovatus]|uniref:Uncharacterized protein n=1 Tax=Bacteroides ovatus TaxID=28116 RepID=A0A6N2XD36_BACOV
MVRLEIQAGREEGGQDGRHDRNEILRDIYQQRAQGGTKKGRQRARGKASLQEGRDGGGHRKTGALRNQIKEGGGHVYH